MQSIYNFMCKLIHRSNVDSNTYQKPRTKARGSHLVYSLGTHERTTHIFRGAM